MAISKGTLDAKIDKLLGEETPLRVRGLFKKRKETLNEFITKFLSNWNLKNDTIYVDTEEVQCSPDRRRSLGDIYNICLYYYPKCTIEEVATMLYILCDEDEGFRTSYCYTICKRVFYFEEGSPNEIINRSKADEFGYTFECWNEYLDLEINEEEEEEDND